MFETPELADIRTLQEIEDSRVQIAELDDVTRWIELAVSNIPALKKYRDAFFEIEDYFVENGLEGDDLHLWRAYKDLIAQRFSGVYADILEVTDIIAADLFNYFIKHPLLKHVKSRFTEGTIPFTFLGRTEDYYFTYTHDTQRPVAVISIPQGRVSSVWNWLAIPHEIGHDIFAHFFDFEKELWGKIKILLTKHRYTINRLDFPKSKSGRDVVIDIWQFWLDELMADVFGVLFTGPAFVMSRQGDAMLAAETYGGAEISLWNITANEMSKHPTAFLRPLLGTRILKQLGYLEIAEVLDKRWFDTHPEIYKKGELLWVDDRPEGRVELFTIRVSEMMHSFEVILPEILHGKLKSLGGYSLSDIMQFDNIDYVISQVVAQELMSGVSEFGRFVKPRHILAASRVAFETNPDQADIIHASATNGLIFFKKNHWD